MKIIKTLWRILNIVHQVRKKSEKATKIWNNVPVYLTFTIKWKIVSNFVAFLKKLNFTGLIITKIIKTLWRILNIVHQVRKKSSCPTSRRSLRRLWCSQQVRTGTGIIIHGWRGSHWTEEFNDISEIQKFDWKNVCLASTCLQSACLSNEHAPPARKFQKQTQRYMKMPENLSVKKWLFLTLFGKCCST